MKLLDRYIFKTYLNFFIITFMSFISLYMIVDFFQRFRMFLSNHASIIQMASYMVHSVPQIISFVLPAAVLLASLLTYSSLSRFSEITAMKANGISLYRLSVPALAVAAVLSIFLFFFNELITPASIQETNRIVKEDIQKQKIRGLFMLNKIWYHGSKTIYSYRMFDTEKNILRGVTIHRMNPDFTLKTRIDARSAEWQGNHWVFHDLLITSFDENQAPFPQWHKEQVIDLPETPDNFKKLQKDADMMGYFELKQYIEKIRAEGYQVSKYLVDLHGKIAYPFVTFILVIIGMSFSLRSERSGGVMQSIGVGIVIGFSYWIVHALLMSVGKSGVLPPCLAAWGSNILFACLAAFLFVRMKT
ncbi:MAG: LPS export ABC transporter permease LptG [Smithella sp.]|nr:LPS export ABC transporter permease LptG [Smithella sp.]